jgi:tetratricopeptide (TPR) repeat protein
MIRPALAAFLTLSMLTALSVRASDAAVRLRADAHFLAGYDHFRAGRSDEARREWKTCHELDETHDFCEFGLTVIDAGAPKPAEAEAPVTAAPPAATDNWPTAAPPGDRDANQAYLEGVIYYQKGDYEKAHQAWLKAKELAPKDSEAESNAAAGLDKLSRLYGMAATPAGKAPQSLKTAPEKKDEHEALQAYFTGLIHYQKGDLDRARVEWKRALALAPKDSSVESDTKAALKKLDLDEASTRGDRKK